MNVSTRDGAVERTIIIATIVRDEVCEYVASVWNGHLFRSNATNELGKLCVEHYKKYQKAPGKEIDTAYELWRAQQPDEGRRDEVGKFLQELDGEYLRASDQFDNPQLYIDAAKQHFGAVDIEALSNELATAVYNGSVCNGQLDYFAKRLTETTELLLRCKEGGAVEKRFTPIPVRDFRLDKIKGVEYLIEDVLAVGQPCILAGPEKCLKTSLMLDLAVSLATATRFLGSFEVPEKKNVMIMSGESGKETLLRNLWTVFDRKSTRIPGVRKKESVEADEVDFEKRIAFFDDVPSFTNVVDMAALEKELVAFGSQVLIIDTASMAMDGERAENLFVMSAQLRSIGKLCKKLGVTLVLLHHTKSLGKEECRPLHLSDIAYSGFKQFFRQWLLVSRRVLYEPPEREVDRLHSLYLAVGGSAGHSGLFGVDVDEGTWERPKWNVLVDYISATRGKDEEGAKEKENQHDKEKVLKALEKFPDGETKEEIRKSAGLRSAPASLFTELIREGKIVEKKILRGNGHSYDGYSLVGK